MADISTRHITRADADVLEDPSTPGHLAALDQINGDGSPGMILHVAPKADQGERVEAYRARGLSEAFIALMSELSRQGIPYVRFDRDGEDVDGSPAFEW
jgi:hypothetical protein